MEIIVNGEDTYDHELLEVEGLIFDTVELGSKYSLIYTKNHDSRPLVEFKIDYEPCMIAGEYGWKMEKDWSGHRGERQVHPAEAYNDGGYGCTFDRNTLERNDPRFRDIGAASKATVDEWDL